MSFLGDLFLGTSAGAVKGVMEGAGKLAKDIRSAVTGEISPEKKAELLQKSDELDNLLTQGQIKINIEEAKSASVFVAGWRPAIGWVCAISLGAYFIPQYVLAAILWVKVSWHAQQLAPYPIPDAKGLLQLVGGMLGLALWRTVEKIKGVAR